MTDFRDHADLELWAGGPMRHPAGKHIPKSVEVEDHEAVVLSEHGHLPADTIPAEPRLTAWRRRIDHWLNTPRGHRMSVIVETGIVVITVLSIIFLASSIGFLAAAIGSMQGLR